MMWDFGQRVSSSTGATDGSSHSRSRVAMPQPMPRESPSFAVPFMPVGAPEYSSAVYQVDPRRVAALTPDQSRGRPVGTSAQAQRHTLRRPAHSSSPRSPVQSTLPRASASAVAHRVLPTHPGFKYSKCSRRRKAVCIGINYKRQPNELLGCVNDAKNVANFLINHYGYKSGDIVLLTDDSSHSRQIPTRQNMIDAMNWLVKDARENDSLFFHYSGHGGQVRDKDGDEKDGFDEIIFPLDHKKAGYILDDLMHDLMVRPLPAGCRLTAVFDSCHSGTALDLPYIYSSKGRLKEIHVTSNNQIKKASPADVISWSGCKDSQTSADTYAGGLAVGAMSYAFMTSLKGNRDQSYMQLLHSIREILNKKYNQLPQLASSHPIDTSLKFVM